MGYSEVVCRFCGVSFNIGRRRERHEPPSAGWECTGDVKRIGCCLDNPDVHDEINESNEGDSQQDQPNGEENDIMMTCEYSEDDDGDSTYIDQSSEIEDVFEYESDEGILAEYLDGEMESGDDSGESDMDYIEFVDNLNSSRSESIHECTKKCFLGKGYSSNLITAEEMSGCTTAQALVAKNDESITTLGWVDDRDDIEIERRNSYFLSGLTDRVCARDVGGTEFIPTRHGASQPRIDCSLYPEADISMPFHPTCFDIFARLSRRHFGCVNVDALTKWFYLEGGHDRDVYCKDPNVCQSRHTHWEHVDGCEYLAANPLFIPSLDVILRGAIKRESSFSPQAGAFETCGDFMVNDSAAASTDPFEKLPYELRMELVYYLPSREIANLRLSSRAFRQLPIYLWRHLLREEMPWLWEAWCDEEQTPFPWATVTYEALAEEEEAKAKIEDWFLRARTYIGGNIPEIFDQWDADVKRLLGMRTSPLAVAYSKTMQDLVIALPIMNTNWYELYTEITKNWQHLKGLRNRRRIWINVEGLIDRIRKYT